MTITEIIIKKAKGLELTKEEIHWVIDSYVKGEVKDYQMSSLLMAIKLKGMTDDETVELTRAYLEGSFVYEAKDDTFFDKHSTGGVGDKVSIALLPLLGALGMKSLKYSGRGLGFTGGTIDKLDSLKGFRSELSHDEAEAVIEKVGIAILGATEDIVPSDKKIYALRDVTGTVDSLPLIAASIMSKKIVSGSKHILIDLKVGTGAFMETMEDAKELGRYLKLIGEAFDRKVFIAFTSMNQPLGKMIGNGNEIVEVMDIVKGEGPADAHELILKLASEIYSSLKEISLDEAKEKVLGVMKDGSATQKLEEWIVAQGADLDYFKKGEFFKPEYTTLIKAKESGYVTFKSSAEFGLLAIELKAGRKKKEDALNHHTGFKLLVKHGDKVEQYDEIIEIYSEEKLSEDFLERVHDNFTFHNNEVEKDLVVIDELKW